LNGPSSTRDICSCPARSFPQIRSRLKKTPLLENLKDLLNRALASCAQPARHTAHAMAQLLVFGSQTLTGLLTAQNRHQLDLTADYRFYSDIVSVPISRPAFALSVTPLKVES